jgi:hypothetical protein
MTSRLRRFSLVVALAVLGAAAWIVLGPEPDRLPDPGPPGRGAAPEALTAGGGAPSAASGALLPALVPQSRAARYALSFGSTVALAGGGKVPAGTLELAATLEVARLTGQAGADGWIAARLALPRVSMNPVMRGVLAFGEGRAEGALAEPWLVRVDPEGRTSEVRFAPGDAVGAKAVRATLAFAWQAVLPAGAAPPRWEAEEADANGPYRAAYFQPGEGRLEKLFSLGPQDRSRNQAAASGITHASKAAFERRGDRLHALEWAQEGQVSALALQSRAEAAPFKATLRLDRLDDLLADNLDGGSPEWARGLRPEALEAFSAGSLATARTRPEAHRPVQVVLEALSGAGGSLDVNARAALRGELVAAIREDPASAADLAARLEAGIRVEPAERTAIEALASAGTKAAEEAILGLLFGPAPDDALRDKLLVAATLAPWPSPSWVAALTAKLNQEPDPARASHLGVALGGSAHTLAQSDPAAAEGAVASLVAAAGPRIQPAPAGSVPQNVAPASMRERMLWLAALGNTGAPEAFPLIAASLADPEQPVRVSAAHAMRFQGAGPAQAALVDAMAVETDPSVRAAIVTASREIGPAMVPLVEKALFSDPLELVRLEAAYTVAVWAAQAPGMRKVLAEALERERSPGVQESLRNYLKPGRVHEPFVQISGPKGSP